MNYVLTILTNGRRTCFERSFHAFMQHVRPLPTEVYVFDDGGQTGGDFVQQTITDAVAAWAPEWRGKVGHGEVLAVLPEVGVYDSSVMPLGMCAAHKNCHDRAAGSGADWAFHLEDDFVILRPVNLLDLAAVIDVEPSCKQMALVRCPWGREIEFGGYIPHMPGLYERRSTTAMTAKGIPIYPEYEWIATQRNWATNPALMRTDLLRRYEWPAEPGCETAIGPAILADEPDAVFGLWGWGEPWASHIALERQPGAYGY